MPRNLARHEQFLRIFALLDILSNARFPIDDQSIIVAIRERLGLSRLSARTLRRDCEFLRSCGYPVDHVPLSDGRKYGWRLSRETPGVRKIPAAPLTLLELLAFAVARDLLRSFEGTVLWTGIESLRRRFEVDIPPGTREKLEQARRAFHVHLPVPNRYAARPRLISALSGAIIDCREIEIEHHPDESSPAPLLRLRPLRLIIELPAVRLVAARMSGPDHEPPLEIDINRIGRLRTLDSTFVPPPAEPGMHG